MPSAPTPFGAWHPSTSSPLSAVPAAEILTHRMIWSCALLMVLVLLGRQWHKVQAVLRQPKVLLTLAFTSVTVGGNWLLFIWAINNGHMLDASLGYYINPCSTCCSAWCF